MPPEKRRPRPGGNGRGLLEIIAAGSGDGSDHSLEIPVSQLVLRELRADEIPELRALWWRQAALGHRRLAEQGIILITGGRP